MDEKQKERLLLAERWLELAEHSSEIEMRNSLSRIYYAVHHVAIALTGEANHGKIPAELEKREEGLGEVYTWLRDLRSWADYTPGFAGDKYADLLDLQFQFPLEMETARNLYERLWRLTKDEVQR